MHLWTAASRLTHRVHSRERGSLSYICGLLVALRAPSTRPSDLHIFCINTAKMYTTNALDTHRNICNAFAKKAHEIRKKIDIIFVALLDKQSHLWYNIHRGR